MITLRPAHERGTAHFDWLESRHSFSFGGYYDPRFLGFSDLRVINEDWIAPGKGFGTHPHRDMEIFTYVLDGALEHRDSMGNGSVIRPGDVQIMSAGSGVTHSEFNPSASDSAHLLQIWVQPATRGLVPSYGQKHFADDEKRGRLRVIVAPDEREGALKIHQDARVYAGCFAPGERASLALEPASWAFAHLARGQLTVNGHSLRAGDGAALEGEQSIALGEGEGAEVLVFVLRAPNG